MPENKSFAARLRAMFMFDESKTGPLSKRIVWLLLSMALQACSHPIRVFVVITALASTSYFGILEGSLFGQLDPFGKSSYQSAWRSLAKESTSLNASPATKWKWETGSGQSDQLSHKALFTLQFPNAATVPTSEMIIQKANNTGKLVESTYTTGISKQSHKLMTFSVPYAEATNFLALVHELPVTMDPANVSNGLPASHSAQNALVDGPEQQWVMKSVKPSSNPLSISSWLAWAREAWVNLLDLINKASLLDIVIVTLGYLAMHLSFVSLFISMKRMGSNFWLAASVLFSSAVALVFALTVTTKLGVPMNMVLLSEGLPFLVVTIGFEKPIMLTKAVLSASSKSRRAASSSSLNELTTSGRPMTIQDAVRCAVKEKGVQIVRDYLIEIAILVGGVLSGVRGGLRQFCFLSAWILFFDCLLLFTFYTAILTIKLEINRIKRHVALRKALEEDGVSRAVAEKVAQNNEWPRLREERDASGSNLETYPVFGRYVSEKSVPTFKVLLLSGFIIVNVVNFFTVAFNRRPLGLYNWFAGDKVTAGSVDAFGIAGAGLASLLKASPRSGTIVTVLPVLSYDLQHISFDRSGFFRSATGDSSSFMIEYADQFFDTIGAKTLNTLLRSIEDPNLTKFVLLALVVSMLLNGYLFNVARWGTIHPLSSFSSEGIVPVTETQKEIAAAKPAHRANGAPVVANLPIVNEQILEVLQSENPGAGPRTAEECQDMVKQGLTHLLSDKEVIDLSLKGKIPGHALEKALKDLGRAVRIRRAIVSRTPATRGTTNLLESSLLPHQHYDYAAVQGACCENVIGYLPLPLGVAGPLIIDGQSFFIPMATTEGVLVASTSRGCKAINAGGGATTVLTGDGMTRGPCVSFETLDRAGAAKLWLDSEAGQRIMKRAFDSTSRFARLQSMKTALAGTTIFIRFKTTTGDAMGMNMISKGVEKALDVMVTECGFEDMKIVSLSGNYCTDKKPAAINWIDGRGKSVVAEAIIPGHIVKSVLKADVESIVELNITKNLVGSAMAGSIGGFNAHAANIVTAVFLATGQDPAQNVESSNCITLMKNLHGNLQITVSMPSIEVGTIGGGTILDPQGAMLDLLGVRGAHPTQPGDNSRRLARIIAAAVMAGELSLCGALAAGHLVKSHMAHNRSNPATRSVTPAAIASSENVRNGGIATPSTLAMTAAKEKAKA